MQSIFYGRNESGEEVSIFDVPDGLACKCTCLECNNPLVAYKGNKKAWHFQHKSYCKCTSAEETSLHKLVKNVFMNMNIFNVPAVSYSVGSKVIYLEEQKVFEIASISSDEVLQDNKVTYRPSITLTSKTGEKLYIEVYVTHKSTKTKINLYRKLNLNAIELKFNDTDFNDCRSIEDLSSAVTRKLNSLKCNFTWLSHKSLNKVIQLIEDKGVSFYNASGLNSVLCPSRSIVVSTKVCRECPFKVVVSSMEVRCKGNLDKSELLKISPDTVFPPEDINYAGRCSKCNSNKTILINSPKGEGLVKVCSDCKTVSIEKCPICGGTLALRRNNNPSFESYLSQFIGCDDCSFTLTYLKSNGDFADEIQYTGSLDAIRKDTSRYTKVLAEYRKQKSLHKDK